MKLIHMRIATKDVPALAQFYRNITAIDPAGNVDYVEFRSAAGTLAICSQRVVDLYNAGATRPASNHSAIIEFEVANVDAERARLAGQIKTFVMEPTTQPWGNRSMLFRDPDGNLINFFSRGRRAPTAENAQ